MAGYQPYEPAEGDKSAETAGYAGFLAWFAARIQEYVDRGKESNWASVSPRELMPYPYELQACAEHIVELQQTMLELLRETQKTTTIPYEIHKRVICLLRTPEEWEAHFKEDDAKFRREERARMRKELAAMTPEERKVHKARKELFKRMFNGKE